MVLPAGVEVPGGQRIPASKDLELRREDWRES